MDIVELLQKFLLEQALVLVPVLMFFGYLLKKTPHIANWMIPWILLVLGVAGGLAVLGLNISAVLQGIIAAGVAVFSHQLYSQSRRQGG